MQFVMIVSDVAWETIQLVLPVVLKYAQSLRGHKHCNQGVELLAALVRNPFGVTTLQRGDRGK